METLQEKEPLNGIISPTLRKMLYNELDKWVCKNTNNGQWPRWLLITFSWIF